MRRPVLVAALAGVILTLGACGFPAQDKATQREDEDVPFDLLDSDQAPGTSVVASPTTTGVSVCLARKDGTMAVVTRQLDRQTDLDDILRSLADQPSDQEQALGLTTALSDTSRVTAASAEAGVAAVDLADEFVDSPAPDQLESVTQIVCTATRQPGIGQVQFRIGGRVTDIPRGDGSSTSDPVSPADYIGLVP